MPLPEQPPPRQVAILGVGLLGGSVGLSLRRRIPDVQIVGTSRDMTRRQLAVERGAVHRACESIDEACRDADVVVVAAPVDRIAPMAIEASRCSPPNCLVTDVGSTKAGIVAAIEQDPDAPGKFVAAHPIAGSEKTGVEHATASLFDHRVIVLTPSEHSPAQRVAAAEHFWSLTGGRTVRMTAEDHDAHLAAVSHVPHLVSALIACSAAPEARRLIGSGWRDMTRVAAGDPAMWTAITRENRTAISNELERFGAAVKQLRDLIESEQDRELFQWLAEAKEIKDETT